MQKNYFLLCYRCRFLVTYNPPSKRRHSKACCVCGGACGSAVAAISRAAAYFHAIVLRAEYYCYGALVHISMFLKNSVTRKLLRKSCWKNIRIC